MSGRQNGNRVGRSAQRSDVWQEPQGVRKRYCCPERSTRQEWIPRQEQASRRGQYPRQERSRLRRQRRRRRRVRRLLRLTFAAAVCLAGIWLTVGALQKSNTLFVVADRLAAAESRGRDMLEEFLGRKYAEPQPVKSLGDESEEPDFSWLQVDLAQLYSPYAVLMDRDSGALIAEQNGGARIYPASLTKIMTALLVIENLPDLSETITLPTEMFSMLYIQHASLAGFEPEENVPVRDLLYGILLPSGAECCIACADRIAGSEDAFVELMNEKAKQLGLTDTHFSNSTGLHEDDHYSTAADMAALLRYALQNDVFREVFSCESYTTSATAVHPEGITFESTMFKELATASVTDGTILGGKTGYTAQAGLCLASYADIGGRDYILVTAKADGSHHTEAYHVLDAQNVYDQIGRLL